MAFGALGAGLDTGFGKLGLQPAAGTSVPVVLPPNTFNFSVATSSMYLPLLGGFA